MVILSYEGRIQTVVDTLVEKYKVNPFKNVANEIEIESSGSVEKRLGGNAWKDFLKDVKAKFTEEIKKVKQDNANAA